MSLQEKIIIVASFVFGVGILLMLSAFFRIRLPSGRLQQSIDEISISLRKARGGRTGILSGLGGWLAAVLPGRERVKHLLTVADFPPPYTSVEEFYAQKVTSALLALGGSIVLLLIGSVLVGLPVSLVPLAFVAGAVGFLLPDLLVRQQARQRQEFAVTEMAFLLDRLAMFVAAGYTLPMAIVQVAQRPGGVLTEELRKVAADYSVTGDIVRPLEEMARRLDVPQVYILASQIAMVVREGGEILPALQALAKEARQHLSEVLEARKERNTLMRTAIIAGLILPATTLIIVAPAATLLLSVL